MDTKPQDIYAYITMEEENFKLPIDIMGWQWNMPEHIKTSFYYKHGRLLSGNDPNKPVKNITRPILNLQYRTEDLEVKDIILYVDDESKYHLSFLVKKYHDEVFVKEHDLDTFLDEVNESRIDYGGGLIKNINQARPEAIPLESLAFCDQTDILSGPICIKHYYSPDQLKDMEKYHWGDNGYGATISVDDLIILSRSEKKDDKTGQTNTTPGKYIEIYELHGNMPEKYLTDDLESEKYSNQMHIVAFYQSEEGDKRGVTLYRGKEEKSPFKLILRDKIHGRALGFGGAEELSENQVWVNYDVIRMKEMLDAAAKTIFQTTDPAFASRNKIANMENLEIAVLEEGKTLNQVDTFPRNLSVFEKSVAQWEAHAQQMGAANDAIMGENPASGTPFKLQELVTAESHGLHDYRRGQFAKFIEEVYRDWIIPYIVKEITKGKKFLATLEMEEMQKIAEQMSINESNEIVKEMILNGEVIYPEEIEALKEQIKADFMKDNRKFIEILKDDFKNAPLSISVNVAGKQKDLVARVDKLVNIFRQVAGNPQILEVPQMQKLFNEILEASGLSPIEFGSFKLPAPQPQQMMAEPQPVQANQQL